MDSQRARIQNIRSLKILVVNLMPKKANTEVQLLRHLALHLDQRVLLHSLGQKPAEHLPVHRQCAAGGHPGLNSHHPAGNFAPH